MSDRKLAGMRRRLLWKLMREHSASAMAWPAAIHRGVLVGLLVALGALLGDLNYGAAAGFGALSVGLVPPGISRSSLTRICLGVAIMCAVVGFVVQLAAGTWCLLLLLPLFGYVYGAAGGNGLLAINLTLGPLATAVGLSGTAPTSLLNVVLSAIAILLGGLIAAAAVVVTWPRERLTEVRRAITASLRSLSDLAQSSDASAELHLQSIAIAARATDIIDAADLPENQRRYYADMLDQIYETRVVLSSWLMSAQPDLLQRDAVKTRLAAIAECFQRRTPMPQPDALVEQSDLATALANLNSTVLVGIAVSAQSVHPVPVVRTEETVRTWITGLPASLAPSAPGARQGLRIALGLAVATGISLWLQIPHGYWIAMSFLMVMKPDFVSTVSRSVLRIAGTLIAVVGIAAVFAVTGNVGWVYAVLIIISAPAVMRWMTANHFWASIAMATTMLLLAEAQTPSLGPPVSRLSATLVGCGIALIIFIVLPNWRGSEMLSAMTRAVDAQFKWTTGVLAALANPHMLDAAHLRELNYAARQTLSLAAPVTTAALLEPHKAGLNPSVGADLLAATGRAGLATLALQRVALQISQAQRDWFQSDEFRIAENQVQACFKTALTSLGARDSSSDTPQSSTTEQSRTLPIYVIRLLDAALQLRNDSLHLIPPDH